MVIYPKASGSHRLDSFQTFFEFKHTAASPAEKVMVMALVGTFVTRRLAGDFH